MKKLGTLDDGMQHMIKTRHIFQNKIFLAIKDHYGDM
jgi:hypothetical protein